MIDKEAAIELAAKYLAQRFVEAARNGAVAISEDWPSGAYSRSTDPVWALTVPSDQRSVGASRVLVISRVTGAVIFDGYVGE